jgi:hypothetical protein
MYRAGPCILSIPKHIVTLMDLLQYSKTGSSGALPFFFPGFEPSSWLHAKFSASKSEDKVLVLFRIVTSFSYLPSSRAMKRDVKTVADWDFQRIIPCHGDVIETGAKQAWHDAYKMYFDPTN